ncbi:MAG: protein kinase [Myxococcota bacterium]
MLLGGRYRLISAPLSTGSFGSVFMADDERMPRRVAVKILHPQHAENPTVRARFKRELDAASRVSHENVVTVFDSGEDKNLGLYYVMELVRGTALKDYLNGEPLPWAFTLRIAAQLARALHAIHSAGIVHRDLKPQNIMLVERSSLDELVKVLDFGIASLKTLDEEKRDVELTGARMVLGTPPYMSPEQTYMRSDRERLGLDVDARSDLYAMGVIMYEMAAGRRPFSGDAHDIVVAHRLTKPMPLERMVGVAVPREFADLVMRCLAKDPKDRPQSAKDVSAALKDIELKPIMKWEPMLPSDPQELATLGESAALPVDEVPAISIDTRPRLDLSGRKRGTTGELAKAPPRLGALWAPLGVVVLTAAAVIFAMSAGRATRVSDAADAVAPRSAGLAPLDSPGDRRGPDAQHPTLAAASNPAAPDVATAPPVPAPAPVVVKSEVPHPEVPAPKVVSFMVTTQPPGAQVLIGGKVEGETPANLTFPAEEARKIDIVLRKDKFDDKTVTLAIGPELVGKGVVVVNETLDKSRKVVGKDDGDPFKDL